MVSYSVEQHVQMIKFYYQSGCSLVATIRALRPFYGVHSRPSKSTIQRLVAKFESTGSVNNQPTPVRKRNARSAEKIAAVRKSVQQNPRQSIPLRSQELGLSQTTTWRILRRDLGLHPYKIQPTQELKLNDHSQRREFKQSYDGTQGKLFLSELCTTEISNENDSENEKREPVSTTIDVKLEPRDSYDECIQIKIESVSL